MTTRAVVLGTAQDGGFPHAGCRLPCCRIAREDPGLARRVACLGLVSSDGRGFLVDATPDLPAQVEALTRLDGLLLTHAHMGHVAGLLWLGKEAMAVRGLPVWLGPRLLAHLEANEPWATLFRDGRLSPVVLKAGREAGVAGDLAVTPIPVPHRAEWSETYAFRVRGPTRTLLYLPDIDRFDEGMLESLLEGVDVALLDGSFSSPDELPGRDVAEFPHPLVPETLKQLARIRTGATVLFTHLNHSNPLLLDPGDAPIAKDGETFSL